MRVEVADLLRGQAGGLAGGGHGRQRGVALRLRLRQVMRVRGGAVADHFAKDFCATALRVLECFQREDCGAFTERQSVALRVERAASRR